MARIFNIYFSFDDAEYNAIVSVKSNPFFTEYNLSLPEDLQKQLPSNKIIHSGSGRLLFQQDATNMQTPLMNVIIEAVARYLKVSSPASWIH